VRRNRTEFKPQKLGSQEMENYMIYMQIGNTKDKLEEPLLSSGQSSWL
jgi:hypothetical protein